MCRGIVVCAQVGRYAKQEEQMFDFRASRVVASVQQSLERLGVDYIDVLQVWHERSTAEGLGYGCWPSRQAYDHTLRPQQLHDPEFSPDLRIILEQTLPALQALKVSPGRAQSTHRASSRGDLPTPAEGAHVTQRPPPLPRPKASCASSASRATRWRCWSGW
jgi:hypothetical protein